MKEGLKKFKKHINNFFKYLASKLDKYMQILSVRLWYLSCRVELIRLRKELYSTEDEVRLLKNLEKELLNPLCREVFHERGKVTIVKTLHRESINFINHDFNYLIRADVINPASDSNTLKCNVTLYVDESLKEF